jgi:hypothetical protein
MKKVLKTWLPLLGSWMLMSIELPIITSIIARLANPEINLAAYGGVVYPLALIIEAPIVMILAASTALSKDWASYQRLKKYTLIIGISMSALHLIIAVTPLYYFIVEVLLHVPPEVVEPARWGVLVMTPWTFGIGVRRFQQGAMIRFNRSHMVGETTVVRLITVSIILMISMAVKTIPGTVVAGLAQGLAANMEAIYATLRIRKILPEIKNASLVEKPLTLKRFSSFYVPLAATAAFSLVWMSLISAAISRMPDPLESLAVWSVLTGLLFLLRSPGLAYNEAVVALLDQPRSYRVLRKFTLAASLVAIGVVLLFVLTPASQFWFEKVANLSGQDIQTARIALSIGIPLTLLNLYINYFQGMVVKSEKTRPIFEAVVGFMILLLALLGFGVVIGGVKGVYMASFAFLVGHLFQALWLWIRSRKERILLALTDGGLAGSEELEIPVE